MELENVKRVYFLGIGGIGMSALARYFIHKNLPVAGYDRVSTELTQKLEQEGATIHYSDDINSIPDLFKQKEGTLVVYTPAVPNNHGELMYFTQGGFEVKKRSEVLGIIGKSYKTLAVAGTHGKTTTSTMLAHIMAGYTGCDAFLGGISRNFDNNLVLQDKGKKFLVVEADEYDRSFLTLNPYLAIITSVDADHLDIYGTYDAVKDAFAQFTSQIKEEGYLIIKNNINFNPKIQNVSVLTYGFEDTSDFYPSDIEVENGLYHFTLNTPNGKVENLKLGTPGRYNLENAIAASAAAVTLGIDSHMLAEMLASFKGVQRRFDVRYWGKKIIYMDDYAHHPREIEALIHSIRDVFPNRKITGIFQPHLYSRTRDFAPEFAASLDLLDFTVITDIYPARELPIPGVLPELISGFMKNHNRRVIEKRNILDWIKSAEIDILVTIGAGDIDRMIPEIVKIVQEKEIE